MTNPQVPPAGPPFGGDRVSPILGVASPRKSAEYWRDVFGFSLDPVDGVFAPVPGDDDGVYAIVKRGEAWVHFQRRPAADSGAYRAAPRGPLERDVYVYVDDLTTVFRDLVARGATLVQPPTAMPYGLVELLTEDSDGHRVAFGQFIP